MSPPVPLTATEIWTPEPEPPARRGYLSRSEDMVVTLVLAAIVALPLAESVLRKTLHVGISGSTALVQHLTLILGMIGGVIAAREQRLLPLSTLGTLLKGKTKTAFSVFSSSCAIAVGALLGWASLQFALSERPAAKVLAYGIPIWIVQLVMPLGFAMITAYLVWHASGTRIGRLVAAVIAGVMILACALSPIPAEQLTIPALIVLLVATLFGVPVFVTVGGVALVFFWRLHEPIASIPIDHYSLVTNPSLPTMPLFTLAGYFLAEGGASKRLLRVFQSLFGPFRGGPAIVTALVCAFFTSFTGASGVTILALGGLLMPMLVAAKFKERDALGLVTGAGSLGLLFPPCLPLILYAIVAKIPIKDIFLGGIGPGTLMLAMTAGWGIMAGRRGTATIRHLNWLEIRTAAWEAKWELLLPVVAFVALFGGFATPVEAAAVTALYAFFTETVIYCDLKITKDVPRVMADCGLLIGGVLLIWGVALGVTDYMVDSELVVRAVDWTTHTIQSPWVFLLLLNLFLLIVGCVMDMYAAIVIEVPLLVPLGVAYHINPIHLGIVFLANMELGYLTPPVGLNALLSSYRFKKPLSEVLLAVLPIDVVLLVGVLLITYVPALTTWLPGWLGR
ncbi:MAG: TRAP transporter large permease subunit [Terriglobia bacterium]